MRSNRIPGAESLWTEPSLDDLDLAILCTVAYADVFDYPLTPAQIHRYLVGMEANQADILQALDGDRFAHRGLGRRGAYVTLRERSELVKLREWRGQVATQMWPLALRYGQAIAALPFVRAVFLTGALAVANVDPGDDFDFMIVTAPNRLWLARAIVIGLVVKPAARRGHEICPNYLLSLLRLDFEEQNLYIAHELAQMIPLVGIRIYHRMRAVNHWMMRFLPNARGLPRPVDPITAPPSSATPLVELALGTALGGMLEDLERGRKIRRFTALEGDERTTCFSADRCKGHFESNEGATLEAFDERLRKLAGL